MAQLSPWVFWAARWREPRFLLEPRLDIMRHHRRIITHMRRRRPITTRHQLPLITLQDHTTVHDITGRNITTAATEQGQSTV